MPPENSFSQPKNLYAFIFLGLSLFLGILMPVLSQQYAISWDEWTESNYGRAVLKYILSAGENTSFSGVLNIHLYSTFFSVVTCFLYGLFFDPFSHFLSDHFFQSDRFFAFFQFSHLINSLFGFYLFFFTGLCAKELRGWRAACAAFLLMVVSPRIFGHSMNNHEDIPFAMSYMLSILLMIRFLKQIPAPSLKSAVFLAVAMGLCIGSRVGGVILIFHLFVFGTVFYAYHAHRQKQAWLSWSWLGGLAMIALYAYTIGLFFWPYGQRSPFLNLFHVLRELSSFPFTSGEMLFQGRLFPSIGLPRTYPLVWIWISTPLVVLAGWFLFCLLIPGFWKTAQKKSMVFLAFTGFFPLAFVVLKHSILYNDWRHLYFIYGPLVVFAALGWDFLWDFLKSRKVRVLFAGIFIFLVFLPLSWMVRNHPFQALYFNEIEGGLKGAAGRYEIDYWGVTLRKAAEELADYHLKNFPDRPAHVRAGGYVMTTYAILREKLGSRYFPYSYPDEHIQTWEYRYMNIRYTQNSLPLPDWDYGIFPLHQQTVSDIQRGAWPPPDTFLEIKVDGITVCAVVKNPRSSLFKETAP